MEGGFGQGAAEGGARERIAQFRAGIIPEREAPAQVQTPERGRLSCSIAALPYRVRVVHLIVMLT